MKKAIVIAGALAVCCFLTGCKKFSPEVSGISINDKNMITEVIKEEFSNTGYNEEELSAQISKAIDDYNIAAGAKCIKGTKLKVKDGVATVKLNYASPEDFAAFNNVDFYLGDMVGAIQAGYTFQGKYDAVSKGEITEREIWGSSLMSGDTSLKTVVVSQPTLVEVPGDILYVSTGMTVTSPSTAVSETRDLSYIIYE